MFSGHVSAFIRAQLILFWRSADQLTYAAKVSGHITLTAAQSPPVLKSTPLLQQL